MPSTAPPMMPVADVRAVEEGRGDDSPGVGRQEAAAMANDHDERTQMGRKHIVVVNGVPAFLDVMRALF